MIAFPFSIVVHFFMWAFFFRGVAAATPDVIVCFALLGTVLGSLWWVLHEGVQLARASME